MRALLEQDVLYRARQIADGGTRRLFCDLDPAVSWDDGILQVECAASDDRVRARARRARPAARSERIRVAESQDRDGGSVAADADLSGAGHRHAVERRAARAARRAGQPRRTDPRRAAPRRSTARGRRPSWPRRSGCRRAACHSICRFFARRGSSAETACSGSSSTCARPTATRSCARRRRRLSAPPSRWPAAAPPPAREVVGVDLRVLLPLVGELVLGEARVHRAGLDAGVAVDALLGVDVEHLGRVVVRARRASGGCSRPGRPRRRSCPWCRCTARRSRRPFASFVGLICGAPRAGDAYCTESMLLLTGATGLVGSRRCCAACWPRGEPVRCLVRDPRRLGPQRVRVQIALGDLTDPPSFRNALRGVQHGRPPRRLDPRPAAAARSRSSTGSPPGAWSRRPSARGVERFVFFSRARRLAAPPQRASCAPRRSPSRPSRDADLRLDRVRALDRLRARRPLADAARAPGAAAGDAGLRPRAGAATSRSGPRTSPTA